MNSAALVPSQNELIYIDGIELEDNVLEPKIKEQPN